MVGYKMEELEIGFRWDLISLKNGLVKVLIFGVIINFWWFRKLKKYYIEDEGNWFRCLWGLSIESKNKLVI